MNRRELLANLANLAKFGIVVASTGLETACATLETVVKSTEPSAQPSTQASKHQQEHLIQPQERKYAVLLVDATDYGAHNPQTWIDLEHELECMGKVLQEANRQEIPVFEITFSYCSRYNQWGTVICSESITDQKLAQYRSNNWIRIRKKNIDSFKETWLYVELSMLGITDLIVMGYNQTVCVRETVKSANRLGYRVHTSFDLIQGQGSSECKLLVNGVTQSIKSGNCQIEPNRASGVDVKRIEYYIKDSERFYMENTHLVEDYSQLPIFRR